MFLQAADSVPASTQAGEWASGFIVIAIGVALILVGRKQKRESPREKPIRKVGIGIALVVLGALIVVARVSGLTDSGTDRALDDRLAEARAYALDHHFRVSGNASGSNADTSFVGDDAAGKIVTDDEVVQFVKAGQDFFLKGNAPFWQSVLGSGDKTVLEYLDGRWLLIDPTDKDFAPFFAAADRKALIDSAIPRGTGSKRGDDKKIAGVDCLALEGTSSGTVYVDAKTSRPMRFVDSKGNIGNLSYEVKKPTPPKKFTKSSAVFG